MAESINEMKLRGEPLRIPEHSLLYIMGGDDEGCWSMGGCGE